MGTPQHQGFGGHELMGIQVVSAFEKQYWDISGSERTFTFSPHEYRLRCGIAGRLGSLVSSVRDGDVFSRLAVNARCTEPQGRFPLLPSLPALGLFCRSLLRACNSGVPISQCLPPCLLVICISTGRNICLHSFPVSSRMSIFFVTQF